MWTTTKLSFQTHTKHLQSKIKSRIGFLFRNKASFTHAAKHTLVKLTILPILDFGDVSYKITLYSANWMQSITVPSILSPKPQYYPPLQSVCSRWLALASYSSPNPLAPGQLQVSARFLSSLVTIAAPTRNTSSSRNISLVTPKANSSFGRISFQFSAANDWNELQNH